MSVSPHALGSLQHVQQVNLHLNNLAAIPHNMFKTSEKIQKLSLHLPQDSVVTLESHAFAGLIDVGTVEIRGGQGTVLQLSANAFSNLVGVRELVIKDVNLKMIKRHAFQGMSKIQEIRVERCTIDGIHKEAFGKVNTNSIGIKSFNLTPKNAMDCSDCTTWQTMRNFNLLFKDFSLSCEMGGDMRTVNKDNMEQVGGGGDYCLMSNAATGSGIGQFRRNLFWLCSVLVVVMVL